MIRSHMTPAQVASAARKDVGHLLAHVAEKHAELARTCPKKGSDKELRRSGRFTTRKGLQWIYVVTATKDRLTIYPLLWYPTTKGVCAMQIDAEGPASFYQEHLMEQYIDRYMRSGDLWNALREFHLENYAKVFLPDEYKGDRENYVGVMDHGYVAGEYQRSDAVVYLRTFYDLKAGEKRFGHYRTALQWRGAMQQVEFEHVGRRDTQHTAWGRGYVRNVEDWSLAA